MSSTAMKAFKDYVRHSFPIASITPTESSSIVLEDDGGHGGEDNEEADTRKGKMRMELKWWSPA